MSYRTTWPVLSGAPSAVAPGHVDPSTIPLEQLARIRGQMWTARLDVDYGPRPFQPNNVLATDFIYLYSLSEQQRMMDALKARGYTHVVIGPCTGDGYHGQYPDYSFVDHFDQFLDVLQRLWDNGLIPIVFIKGYYWTIQELLQYEHLFTSARAQRLLRVVVPAGWEPDRNTPNATWVEYLSWGARVFPSALRIIHMVADHDAPGSSAEGILNDQLWRNVIRFIHVWMVQSFAFEHPDQIEDNGQTSYQVWLDSYDITVKGSYPDRFINGYAGWPTFSAWGDDKPLLTPPSEWGSYTLYWHGDRLESESQAWGDAAMGRGATAYMDGGTVPVP